MTTKTRADVENTALELHTLLRTNHDLVRADVGLIVCTGCEKPLAIDPYPLLVPRHADIDPDANTALVARIEWDHGLFRYDRDLSLRSFGSVVEYHWSDTRTYRQDIPLEDRVRMVRPLLILVDETTGTPRHIVVDSDADRDALHTLVCRSWITDRMRISVVRDDGTVGTSQYYRNRMGTVTTGSYYTTDTLTDAIRLDLDDLEEN